MTKESLDKITDPYPKDLMSSEAIRQIVKPKNEKLLKVVHN